MKVIEIKDGQINYIGSNKNLLKFNLLIHENDFSIFVGKNGCGKTTLLDTLIGFRQLQNSSTYYNAYDTVAYCVQDFNGGLFPWLSLINNILLPLKTTSNYRNDIENYAFDLLKRFNLFDRKNDFPYQLSGGQKQVVNIIRTLCTPSKLLLFDEPFSSLHSDNINVARLIIGELGGKKTIILISHTQDDLLLPINRYFTFENNDICDSTKDKVSLFLNEKY
ncbi:MAG: ATP-binding cassette domain-containing protein [Bacteroidetes bacterium]|nr:ATP-binding cassette domain-containing protein [Bacteroidota bacterium]